MWPISGFKIARAGLLLKALNDSVWRESLSLFLNVVIFNFYNFDDDNDNDLNDEFGGVDNSNKKDELNEYKDLLNYNDEDDD